MMNKIIISQNNINETIWAKKKRGNQYYVKNSPFLLFGLSFNDLIEITTENESTMFYKLVKPSGHSTYRVYLYEKKDLQSIYLWRSLENLGCTFENADSKLYSIDIPPQVNIFEVYSILEKGEKLKIWEFEEANFAHKYSQN